METEKNISEKKFKPIDQDFFDRLWKESWIYIKTVVDVLREPVLILDKDFRVMAANEPFYSLFQVGQSDTEGKIVYELGNGQWNIPSLRKLLEDVLPKHTFFKGFEVEHEFPFIGHKTMIVNARQIHSRFILTSEERVNMYSCSQRPSRSQTIGQYPAVFAAEAYINNDSDSELFPPIILLAIEDITDVISVAEKIAGHVSQFESTQTARAEKLEISINELKKQIQDLKNKMPVLSNIKI